MKSAKEPGSGMLAMAIASSSGRLSAIWTVFWNRALALRAIASSSRSRSTLSATFSTRARIEGSCCSSERRRMRTTP